MPDSLNPQTLGDVQSSSRYQSRNAQISCLANSIFPHPNLRECGRSNEDVVDTLQQPGADVRILLLDCTSSHQEFNVVAHA